MCISITEIIAIIIGLAMFIGRGHALLYPKAQRQVWKKIGSRPDCSIRQMGAIFLVVGFYLLMIATETADIGEIVTIAAGGWFLLLGSGAFAVRPLKAVLKSYPRVNRTLLQVSNALVAIAGLLIIYLILK